MGVWLFSHFKCPFVLDKVEGLTLMSIGSIERL